MIRLPTSMASSFEKSQPVIAFKALMERCRSGKQNRQSHKESSNCRLPFPVAIPTGVCHGSCSVRTFGIGGIAQLSWLQKSPTNLNRTRVGQARVHHLVPTDIATLKGPLNWAAVISWGSRMVPTPAMALLLVPMTISCISFGLMPCSCTIFNVASIGA